MFGFMKRREHEWRILRLEENDKDMFKKLDNIEHSLRAQEKVYDKLDRTFAELKQDRLKEEQNKKENAKNIRELKVWMLGVIGTILSTIIIAILRTFFGI
ncbi:TPA: DUF2951 family protein [Staphylococcus pseudintermedius]|uniref:DUF2951 family protein n=1 Tax=Staphylococcus pseudintermedius TaxID=283734 RepID=UPI000BD0FFC5|nr:DUF2951 family protein [Staphylococcus pseudintermedius]EHT3160143.1 DUF2951 family protein [Staphylococcus pseudintermedius]EIE3739166.1 DUF2951 family protein [Staphylococcus pseudintermedius]EIE3749235.1 DUF2951 family protein [Staphylococcus pseudintermedius]EIE3779395.1 DUF2951 family protein [Staphylococcus pseudintermedius]EJA1952559.1 DUF2951 family protein [Staphylococcus pseudintermedius]